MPQCPKCGKQQMIPGMPYALTGRECMCCQEANIQIKK